MLVSGLIQKAKFLVVDNADSILTGMAVTGTVATAVLTGRASFKAARLIDEERLEQGNREGLEVATDVELATFEKVKISWRLYLPAVATGTTTLTCIIMANRISSKKIAALAVASGISERALQEYKTKVIEKLGDKHEQKIRDEIAQDRVTASPPGSQIIVAGDGKVLCYDMLTGRYFQSSVEEIKRAENKINFELVNHMYVSLSEFYDELGLPATTYTDMAGWNNNNAPVNVILSTVMSPDQRPCIAIDFERVPIMDYDRFD